MQLLELYRTILRYVPPFSYEGKLGKGNEKWCIRRWTDKGVAQATFTMNPAATSGGASPRRFRQQCLCRTDLVWRSVLEGLILRFGRVLACNFTIQAVELFQL